MTLSLPWHRALLNARQPVPATLVVGNSGHGGRELALSLAAIYGETDSVQSDPDVLFVVPEAEKKLIRIDAVREIVGFFSLAPVRRARRVSVILQAELLTIAAANMLLKTLEEPQHNRCIVLLAPTARQLPATIVSRCHIINAPPADAAAAEQWLAEQGGDATMLPYCGGMPLQALQMSADWPKMLAGYFRQGARLPVPQAATELSKSAPAVEDWLAGLQKWASDGIRTAFGLSARYFPAETEVLRALSDGRQQRWLDFYRFLLSRRELFNHPLAKDLFIREILYAYRHLCAD